MLSRLLEPAAQLPAHDISRHAAAAGSQSHNVATGLQPHRMPAPQPALLHRPDCALLLPRALGVRARAAPPPLDPAPARQPPAAGPL